MIKKYFLISFLFIFNFLINAQDVSLKWATATNSTLQSYIITTKLDSSGDLISLGRYIGTLNFSPQTGDSTYTSDGFSENYFIQKTNSNGDVVWIKVIPSGFNNGIVSALELDQSGHIYILGSFKDSLDFDLGNGEHFSHTPPGVTHRFLAKYTNNCDFEWVKQMQGSANSYIENSMCINNTGDIYIVGNFGNNMDFDPGIDTFMLNGGSVDDVYIQKLNAQGEFVWAKQITLNTGINPITFQLNLDSSGDLFISGVFEGTIDFDPNASIYNLTAEGSKDLYILKLNAQGEFIWAKQLGNSGSVIESSTLTLDHNDNLLLFGVFKGTIDFDPGLNVHNQTSNFIIASFILQLDHSGNFNWVKCIQLQGNGFPIEGEITTDQYNNIYTTFEFLYMLSIEDGSDTLIYNAPGTWIDIMLLKTNTAGDVIWGVTFGGSGSDNSFDVLVDSNDMIYTSGGFHQDVDFDPNNTVLELSATGSSDAFIQKLNQCFYTNIDALEVCDSLIWRDGLVYNENNETATYIKNNGSNLCDSVWTLNLDIIDINATILPFGPSLVAQQAGASYQWLDCDNNYTEIPMETAASFIPDTYGNYAVEIVYEGCSVISDCYTYDVFSNPEQVFNNINIYPNPTSNSVTLDLNKTMDVDIVILDVLGNQVYKQTHISKSKLDIKLPPYNGIYIVELASESVKKTLKVVKR